MISKLAGIFLIIITAFTLYLLAQKHSALKLPLKTASLISVSNDIKPQNIYKPSLPSIDQIFEGDHAWVATLSAQQVRTVIATGDVIPARSVNFKVLAYKDFRWPYLKTTSVTKNADITLINLETPLINKCPVTQEGMVFCGDARNVEGLVYAGVGVASLANNHAANYGADSVKSTVKLLNDRNILTTGVDGAVIRDVRGIKFAFLGYNDVGGFQLGISNVNEEKIKNEIAAAKRQADIVIVTFHWGIEYQDQPDKRQQYLGHLAIDAGADLVIGNHPHWVQPIENYKNKLVTYAHGNFVFDQMWSQRTREGVIGKYTFFDKELIDVQYLPVQINDFGQPDIAGQAKAREILERMKNESIKLKAQL